MVDGFDDMGPARPGWVIFFVSEGGPFAVAFLIGTFIVAILFILLYHKFSLLFSTSTAAKKRSEDLLPISIFMNGIIIDESSYELVCDSFAKILELSDKAKIFLMIQVPSEDKIDIVMRNLEASGAFDRGIARHRVLFSQTMEGRVSMVGQLQPCLHIESNEFVANSIAKKVANIILVTKGGKPHDYVVCMDLFDKAIDTIKALLTCP